MLLETTVSAGAIFGSEFLGTMILIILGVGVVANNLLPKTKGNPGPGSLQINWGWGFGVMFGVYGAYRTGGHLNPAVTVGLALAGKDLAPGVEATAGNICLYIIAQFLGAFVAAGVIYGNYLGAINIQEGGGNIRTVPGTASLFATYAVRPVPVLTRARAR